MKRSLLGLTMIASFSCLAEGALDLTTLSNNNTDNLVRVGHLSPDTDSAVSVILASHIYGGEAALTGEANPESKFVFEFCGMDAPKVKANFSSHHIGLVDFNQSTQLAKSVDPTSIVAIIDHHAMGSSPISMPQIVTMDIRAWGSAATILTANAEKLNVKLPKNIACAGLGAILSDTVVFQSSTTTEYDKQYAQKLADIAGIKDIKGFGEQMLLAKSDLSHFSAETILTMDYKNFEFAGKKVGIGVAETLNAQQLIDRKQDFNEAIQAYKKAQNLDYLFFSITDTKHKRANMLWADDADKKVLSKAFDVKIDNDMLVLDGVTSRKRQIGPAIQQAIESL